MFNDFSFYITYNNYLWNTFHVELVEVEMNEILLMCKKTYISYINENDLSANPPRNLADGILEYSD